MGIDLHYGFYPKKCVDKEILPYLDIEPNEPWDWGECWLNGKHMPEGFYDTCRELAIDDKENGCYIFDDCVKLFRFAARTEVPDSLNNYITKYYTDEVPIFIIWVR